MRPLAVLLLLLSLLLATLVQAQHVERHIPRHDVTILSGCSQMQRQSILDRIGAAIDIGAPLYNAGDHEACYREYERVAREIEGSLSNACSGPSRALREGRAIAAARSTDTARAWAMRDALDGLLAVLLNR